jgi:hypothetical protein
MHPSPRQAEIFENIGLAITDIIRLQIVHSRSE